MLLKDIVSGVLFNDDELSVLIEGRSISLKVRNTGGPLSGMGSSPTDSLAVGELVGKASSSIRRRMSNRATNFHLFADNIVEKRLYELVVKDLLSTKKYRLVRRAIVSGGGIVWEIKRL